MKKLILALGKYKDGITTALAILFVSVGLFQYLEFRSDKRVEASLNILERRESRIFVEARTYLLQRWFEADGTLKVVFQSNEEYTEALYKEVDKVIHSDKAYRSSLLHISALYSNASACLLDGLCDAPTLCASLVGEVQDYLDINKNYFVYLRRLRQEDAVSLYLHQSEFVNYCISSLGLTLYARTDRGFPCRVSRSVYRYTGFRISSWCKGEETEYTQAIIDLAQ